MITVRHRMPDTNSSSGIFVSYSSPPVVSDISLPRHGNFVFLSPLDVSWSSEISTRFVTRQGRIRALLNFLLSNMVVPAIFTCKCLSASDAELNSNALSDFVERENDELVYILEEIEKRRPGYTQEFETKREMLQNLISVTNGRSVLYIPRRHYHEIYAFSSEDSFVLPNGWVRVIGNEGGEKCSLHIGSESTQTSGHLFKRQTYFPEVIKQRRAIKGPIPNSFVKSVIAGDLAFEYSPEILSPVFSFITFAEVSQRRLLFCVNIDAPSSEIIRNLAQLVAGGIRPGKKMIESARLFIPGSDGNTEYIQNSIVEFAQLSGLSFPTRFEFRSAESMDSYYHLAISCSAPIGEHVLCPPDVTNNLMSEIEFQFSDYINPSV